MKTLYFCYFMLSLNASVRFVVALLACVAIVSAKIMPHVHRHLATYGSMDIFIKFRSHREVLASVTSTPAMPGHREAIVMTLQKHAGSTQKAALALLREHETQSFWITSSAVVRNASSAIIAALALLEDVVAVEPVHEIELDKVLQGDEDNVPSKRVEWGIAVVGAPAVWPKTNGSGVIVGSIDTGVRHSHEALRDNWRRHRGWFDPYNQTQVPSDDTGHGTHTTGTMVGRHGIGIAPGAQWIACKGLLQGKGTSPALLSCAQFMLCPTYADGSHPDCTAGADVVNNSWGGAKFHPWFEDAVAAWHKAGVTPVFSIGNHGPSCGTAGNPGGYPNVLSVGAIGSPTNDPTQLAHFSAKGPARYIDRYGVATTLVQPLLVAPGFFIRSAKHTTDRRYVNMAGTSMAAPHVSGVVALLKSLHPSIQYDEIRALLTTSSERSSLQSEPSIWLLPKNKTAPGAKDCNGTLDSTWPNNRYGYGRVDVVRAISKLPVPSLSRLSLFKATPVNVSLETTMVSTDYPGDEAH
ncbi:serine protease family S08A [Achlya hypogyna]|uniref:subtilisin n=1 Tax=Achlya hypogyna TaxID=1202772 RepID=A0A1V9YSF9_ACHHY|nr:serine protease family S08A [Achlya hypogyna]